MVLHLLFRNNLPLEKEGALHMNKLENHSSKDALSQVWLKLTFLAFYLLLDETLDTRYIDKCNKTITPFH